MGLGSEWNWLIVFCALGFLIFRALQRRLTTENQRNIPWALIAAAITGACVFAATYGSAWVSEGIRPFVALGRVGDRHVAVMASALHERLDGYALEHGDYPDSLDDAFQQNEPMRSRVDPWENPYHYERTGDGYRLLSLGRDGKLGGVGLDADFELPAPPGRPEIPITFRQFLFEGTGSGGLFLVALSASFCGGLACLILAGKPRPELAHSWLRILLSALVATVAALLLVPVLMAVHMIGSGH